MSNFICGICGIKHTDLDSYLKCVAKCGETLKAEQKAEAEKERLIQMNAALNRVKEAKKYLEEQLAKFEKEYPTEYKLNFGEKHKCSNNDNWYDAKNTCKCSKSNNTKSDVKTETIELSYEDNGKDKPKMTAKINGKDVDSKAIESLLDDPETKYIAKMLGLI